MRNLMILFSALLMASSLTSAPDFEEGNYYNRFLGREIFIKHSGHGLRIKGIHSRHRWSEFVRCGHKTYMDRHDNVIKITGRSKIVYYDRNGRAKLTFYPWSAYNHRKQNKHFQHHDLNDDDRYEDNHRRNRHNYGDEDDDFQDVENDRLKNRISGYNLSLEGTWYSKEFDKKVYIVDTRDGLKARFSDQSAWYVYKTNTTNSHKFSGENGHSYERMDENKMIWMDSSGQRRYQLTKMSDKID